MTLDTVFTVLNAVWTVLLAGLGIEMVNNPPDVIWKKRLYRGLFVLFGGAVLVTTTIQSVHNSKEQQNLKDEAQKIQTALSNKVSEQGGKLDAIVEFQQQFLSVMSHREASGTSDASVKAAYQAAAVTVMKMAQDNSTTKSNGLSGFSNRSFSIMANDIADRLVGAYYGWRSRRELIIEHYGPAIPNARTQDEKNKLSEQQKTEMEQLEANRDTELTTFLKDGYLVCEEIVRRTTRTPEDKNQLSRFQNAIQNVRDDGGIPETYARYLKSLAKRLSPQ